MVQSRAEPSASIEEAFFRTVAVTLALPAGWRPGREELEGLRTRLRSPELSEDEMQALTELAPGAERLSRLLSLRATLALADATRSVAAERGVAVPSLLPEAVVVRGRNDASSTLQSLELSRTLAATRGLAAPVPPLIVADDEAHATLTGEPTGTRPATVLVEVQGLENGATVVRATRSIQALEEHARAALDRAEASGALPEDPLLGRLLGNKYLVKKRIGRGGFGTVYLAEDKGLGALVAVKVLNERAARSEQALESFFQEAKLLTTLDHPSIVRWITFDRTQDGLPYFVMEYVQGKQLDDILKDETRLPPKRVAGILLQIVDALRAAHEHRDGALLHLDLKPNNVLVLERFDEQDPERIKVIDFGISQSVGAAAAPVAREEPPSPARPGEDPLERSIGGTVTAELLARDEQKKVRRARGGTLLYASPEQCEHLSGKEEIRELDGRSDLYSLGVMAFRMLTGRFPFDMARTAEEALRNHLEVPPRKTGKVDVKLPRRLAAFVDRCLLKDRDQRWPDAAAAYRELDEIVHPRAKVLPIVGALVLVFGGILAWLLTREPPVTPTIARLRATDPATQQPVGTFAVSRASSERKIKLHDWAGQTGWLAGASVPELALVDPDNGRRVSGWRATWADPEDPATGLVRIEVDPERDPEALTVQAVLKVLLEGEVKADTEVLPLRFVDAWTIGKPTVLEHDEAKELDPVERRLRVPIQGPSGALQALEEVRLFLLEPSGASELAQATKPSSSDAGEAVFHLTLQGLVGRPRGEVSLRIEARDQSGVVRPQDCALRLAGERIRLLESGFQVGDSKALAVQDEYLLSPDLHSLWARFNRRGELRIEVLTDGGPRPPVQRPIPDSGEVTLPITELGLSASEPAFKGSIRLTADDRADVDGPAPLDPAPALKVNFQPKRPTLDVALGALVLEPLPAWNHLAVPPSGKLRLQVTRRSADLSLRLQSTLRSSSGASSRAGDDLRVGTTLSLEHELLGRGSHDLSVTGLYLAGDSTGDEMARFEARLFVDDTPPVLELSLSPAPRPELRDPALGIDRVTSEETSIRLVLRDEGPLVAKPVWTFTGPDLRPEDVGDAVTLDAGLLDASAEPRSGELAFEGLLEGLFSSSGKAARDGSYSLTVRARNAVAEGVATLHWQIAYDPPDRPDLIDPVPSQDGKNTLNLEDAWKAIVRIDDPNGIRSVSVSVERDDGRTLDLGALVREGTSDRYRLGDLVKGDHVKGDLVKLVPDWSEREVRFRIRGEDSAGNGAEWTFGPYHMPRIEVQLAECLVARDDPADQMVLVRGNEGYEYRACGNRERQLPGEVEDELLNIRIEPGALESFYMDVHEVTQAQFRAFLEHEQGYERLEHWPAGFLPSPERKRELLAALDPSRPELPMTSVNLAEASAYARFRRKRLPTLLEWEFVVRGGKEYRGHTLDPSAIEAGVAGGAGPAERTLRAATGGLDHGYVGPSASAGRGPGLWNLVTNAREWTWTESVSGVAPSADALLRCEPPVARAGLWYFWVVGGVLDEDAFDYQQRVGLRDLQPYADVGFRCALGAAEAQRQKESGWYDECP